MGCEDENDIAVLEGDAGGCWRRREGRERGEESAEGRERCRLEAAISLFYFAFSSIVNG